MNCRFYGKNGMFGKLIAQDGNECALITAVYAPCEMEVKGDRPDEARCARVDVRGGAEKALAALVNPKPAEYPD